MSGASAATVQWPEVRIVGDTSKFFRIECRDEDSGELLQLNGATATFKMKNADTGDIIVNDLPCAIDGGVITYVPVDADVASAGHFLGRYKVVTSDGIIKFGIFNYEICSDL